MELKLKDKHVRDLFWLIASPSPIKEYGVKGLPLLPSLIQNNWVTENTDFFIQLDADPSALHAFLKERTSTRLGIYAEFLLHYFFEHSPYIQLILHNYQVIENKQTIGEVDFVIEYKGNIMHIELAVKYYLDTQQNDLLEHWIGPSGNDNLYKKIERVVTHQLPLGSSPMFRKQTKIYATSYFWLRGVFFTNTTKEVSWKNPKANFGRFYTFNELPNEMIINSNHKVLQRPHWMMDTKVSIDTMDDRHSFELPDSMEEVQELINIHGALLVKCLETSNLFFIVSDEWTESYVSSTLPESIPD